MGWPAEQSHQNSELRTDAGVVPAGYRALHRDPDLGGLHSAREVERDVARTCEVVRRVTVANPAHLVADGEAEHPIAGLDLPKPYFETTHKNTWNQAKNSDLRTRRRDIPTRSTHDASTSGVIVLGTVQSGLAVKHQENFRLNDAQNRDLASGARGHRFESCRAYQISHPFAKSCDKGEGLGY